MKRPHLCAIIPFAAAACVTVRPVATPASFIPQRQPELVWVTSSDHEGQTIPVGRPMIQGDSLYGQWLGTSEHVRLHLPRVTSVFARQPDRTRTTLLVAGATLVAGFIVWRATNASGKGSGCVFDARSGWYCPP